MFAAAYFWAGSLALLAFSARLELAMIACAMTGLFGALLGSLHMSVVQLIVKPEVRGRIMSILMMTFGLMPLGVMPISALAEYVGIDTAFLVSALMLVVSMYVLDLWFPGLRKIDRGHGFDD